MIISRIYGGMGNQMFQYAFGRMLSIKHNTKFKIYFDDCGFGWAEHSKYLALNKFNIQAEIATVRERAQFICDSGNIAIKALHKIKRTIKGLNYIGDAAKVHEYHYNALVAPDNSYTDGFWQSEIYFKDIEAIIRNDFSIKIPLSDYAKSIEQQIISSNAVGIHVRRGDYLQQTQTYVICGTDYYRNALNVIKSKVEDISIFIFSNDAEWVKENLKFNFPTVVVEGTEPYEDMHLMSCCKHNISSNSTFGWWGAWLNPDKDKVVILPERWLTDSTINTDHYTPKGWLRI
jgi:hypothetical protein